MSDMNARMREKYDYSYDPVGEKRGKLVFMSQREFESLLEYGFSDPTGVFLGKQWRANRAGTWFMREYMPDPDSREHALVGTWEIIVGQAPPEDCECAGCGRWIPCRHCPEGTPTTAEKRRRRLNGAMGVSCW